MNCHWLGADGQTVHRQAPVISLLLHHAAIIAAQRVAGRLLAPEEIKTCRVRIAPFAARLVGGNFEPGKNPQVAAQFSVQYSVANALVRGGLALEDIAAPAVLAPGVLRLAQRVEVEVDEAATGDYTPAKVELELHDGSTRLVRVDAIPGTRAQPAVGSDLRAKAQACFASGAASLSPDQIARLMARVDDLQAVSEMRNFWDLDSSAAP